MARFIRSQSLILLENWMLWMPTSRRPCVNDCTNSRKNSRTASRLALKPKVKQEHNEAPGDGHSLSVNGCREQTSPSGRVSGF